MNTLWLRCCSVLAALALSATAAPAQLRGHGGPVRALAATPDGKEIVSGSFDTSAIRWSLARHAAEQVLRFHDGAVNAVALLEDGRLATSGEDARIAIWRAGEPRPSVVLTGHTAPVVALAASPDGKWLASASWDHNVRLWPLSGGTPQVLEGHQQNVNGVAFSADGRALVSAGYDATVRIWPLDAAGIRGSVALVERAARRLARTLAVPGPPVWSVAFVPGGHVLLTGGGDRLIRRWDADSGAPLDTGSAGGPEDPLAAYAGDPGAQVFRACVACHTLRPDEGNRAGPTLAGVFGRRIASLPGYNFSEALKKLDIVWTPDTVAKMFEIGPMAYTPGTKMPEQRIGSAEERDALVKFLEKATREK